MTSRYHGSKMFGSQKRELWQRRRRRQRERQKSNNFIWGQNNNFAHASRFSAHFFCHRCTNATWNFLTQHKKFLFLFLNSDSVLSDSTPQKCRQYLVNLRKLNKIDEVWNSAKLLFKWIFGLLSTQNFATMATWRNDFSSLSRRVVKGLLW